jgi:hypothetical protein
MMLVLSTLVALGLVGASAASEPPTVRAPRGGSCAAVEVVSPQDPTRQGRTPEFSATRIIDLRITAVLRAPDSRGIVRLKVFTPGGHLYQTIAVPFVAGGDTAPQSRHVDGSRRAVLEQRAQPGAAAVEYRVETRLPVAGTLITTEGLYGRWTIEPWLDGASQPCLAPKAFVIEP